MIRSGILRAREHDADVRASTREPEIRRVLAAAGDPTGDRPPAAWRRFFAWHPTPSARVAVLDDPTPLLRLGLFDVFGVGIVGSLAYEEVATLIGYFGLESFSVRGLSGLAFGPLVGLIVALGTWRQTFAFLATGRAPVRIVPLGLALVAGLLVGQRLSLVTAISDDAVLLRPDVAPFHLGLTLLVAVGAILFMAWLVATSRHVVAGGDSPSISTPGIGTGGRRRGGAAHNRDRGVRDRRRQPRGHRGRLHDAIGPLRVDGSGSACGRARVAVRTRDEPGGQVDHRGAAGHRVLPDHGPGAVGCGAILRPATRPPDRVVGVAGHRRRAADRSSVRSSGHDGRSGVGSSRGSGIAVVLVILYAGLHSGFDALTRSTDGFLFAFAFWLISVTLAGQLLAGAIAAARAPSFGTLHGALAGLVAGVAGTIAVAITQTTSGCVPLFTVVEGRPCGRPPTVDFVAAYLAPSSRSASSGRRSRQLGSGDPVANSRTRPVVPPGHRHRWSSLTPAAPASSIRLTVRTGSTHVALSVASDAPSQWRARCALRCVSLAQEFVMVRRK